MTTVLLFLLKKMPPAVTTSSWLARSTRCSRAMSASLNTSVPLPRNVWATSVNIAQTMQSMRKSHDASEQVGYDKNECDRRFCVNAVCIDLINGYCPEQQR